MFPADNLNLVRLSRRLHFAFGFPFPFCPSTIFCDSARFFASAEPEPMPHGVLIALTVAIVAGVYVCALVVPAVEKVWALCGSSVCIAVAFILPTSYYLEVRAAKYAPLRKGAARVVLVAAVAMALVCTGIQVL